MPSGSLAPALQRRVAAWLAYLRTTAGITQDELASRLNTATRNLQRIESGKQNLTLQTIESYARAVGVEASRALPIPDARTIGAPVNLVVIPSPRHGKAPQPVPLFTLEAAAGFAKTGRTVDAIGWTLLSGVTDPRVFIASVKGSSMEPVIPDRSWSLFRRADTLPVGRIGLFELRDAADPDGAGAYLVKRLAEKTRTRLVLSSTNPRFAPQTLDVRTDLQVIAEWLSVLS